MMSRIRGKNTKPEQVLRKALWVAGHRGYRKQAKTPVGRPDLVFPGPRVAVFIDGCFWHGCVEHYVRPRTRLEFWAKKLHENVARDQRQTRELEALGWQVVRIWEHAVFTDIEGSVDRIAAALNGADEPGRRPRFISVVPIDPATDMELCTKVDVRDLEWSEELRRPRHTKKWKRKG